MCKTNIYIIVQCGIMETNSYPVGTTIPIIDLEISGRCTSRCPTCWGTPHDMKQEHSLSEWLVLLNYLKENYGLRGIALTGGEPLLVEEIDGFIQEANTGLELNVNLLTNTLLLDSHFDELRPYIASLSIPLDGSTREINDAIRGEGHYDSTTEWMRYLNEDHLDLPLKVGTVVSSLNIENVPDIGDVLIENGIERRYPKQDVWNLYQATPFGAEQNNSAWTQLKISENDFHNLVRVSKERYAGKINLTQLSTNESGGYCIIIRPNGNVVTNSKADGTEYRLFDNIFADADGAMRAIGAYHDVSRGIDRLKTSYFGQGLGSLAGVAHADA